VDGPQAAGAEDFDSPEPPDEGVDEGFDDGLKEGLDDVSAGLGAPSVDEEPDVAGFRLSVR
jgi:hypothetical protein